MANTGIHVGLDIGTTSVKVVVAEYIEGQINIIGVGNAKSEGLNRGIVIDIDKAANTIKRAIAQAEEKSGVQIRKVNVGLPANLLEIEHCEGMIAVSAESKEITDEDVQNVASAAIVRSTPPERQVITLIPREYKVDGFDGIKDPRGMLGVRLDMQGLVFTGPKTIIHNVKKCVEKAGLELGELVITPLALAETVLTDGEKDFGTTLIDMGGGQTTAAVYYDNQLQFTHVEQEGGEFVTKDISVVLNTSIHNAEALKINYGDAYTERTSEDEVFPVEVIGKSEPIKVDERYLSEIIEARMEQIFTKVKHSLANTDALNLPGGVIITGGNAGMPGVTELASEILGTNVHLHVPNHMGLRNPIFSNAISIVEYAATLSDIYHISQFAVTGERFAQTASSTMPRVQFQEPNEVEMTHYEEPVANVSDAPKGTNEKLSDKIKGFFSNMFD